MGVSPQPLVSCVMPTRNRRRFVRQAIWYFLRQDYPRKELLIVDDGEDGISDLLPDDDRIRYVRLDSRTALGAKRNVGCELARGDLIAHWDDDDWFGPRRLDVQVAELRRAGAVACGAGELLHYRLEAGDAWLCRYGGPERPPVAGGTLLYRRDAWAAHPFAELDVGEEQPFLRALGRDGVRATTGAPEQVAVIHGSNAAGQNLSRPCWEQRPFDELALLVGPDLEFYAALRNGGRRSPPARAASPRLTLCSHFMVWDGYGSMAEYMALSIGRAGVAVDVDPLGIDRNGLSDEFDELLAGSRPNPASPALWFSPPVGAHLRFPEASDLFINTMWESDRLPPGWVGALNRARAVIVPTRYVARVFRSEGVTVPVEVVPQGVDPGVYAPIDRPERAGLTTLMVGPPVPRKHVKEGIAAWQRAFEGDREAGLTIKGKFGMRDIGVDDPRIRVVDSTESSRGIAHWYRRADVLLALGNEGFGLPLVEGMATGLPVIALASEGQADVCEAAAGLVLSVPAAGREPCNDTPWGRVGERGVPSVPAVAERLRWVARHRSEARSLGRSASEWALRERNVWAMGPAVLDVMERHMPGRRRLRRRRTLWAPGRPGTESNHYAASLAAAVAGVRLVHRPPDAPTLRLLHVHHEDETLSDADLATRVLEAHSMGLPVAVTQHAAAERIRAWERDADVLVVTRATAAAKVRERWPAKWIEYIPPGCPTWFPPRKAEAGSVIAATGPLTGDGVGEPLGALLRRRRHARVLLFGPSATAGAERHVAGAGQARVRRLDPRLRGRRLAERLAAEADVIALWGPGCDAWPMRAAVRTAVASGVPVATTGQAIDELDGATHHGRDLGDAVGALLDDERIAGAVTERAREFCNDNSWARIAERHVALWNALENG
jgi:Glycosyl transferase family 2/Glycosyl transferases group 1